MVLIVSMLSGCTGNEGMIKVEVTMDEPDQIKDIKIVSQSETGGLGDSPLEKMKEQILEGQTLAVDAVSGASLSSVAMLAAVEDAVTKGGGNLEALKAGGVKKAGEGKTEKLETDVVVVGAGASGVSAAVTAVDKSTKVIIIEKTGVIGGASNLSWAGKFYNSSAAMSNNLKVNVEKEIADQFTLENPWTNVGKVFDSMVENGDGFKGNKIEELATNTGVDVDVFVENYNRYKETTKTGVDTEFGKAAEYLEPVGKEGPYYAIIAEINNLGSVGGLLVNTKFQVLNDKRTPVKGLFAVGLESEGVLFNDTYVGDGVGIGLLLYLRSSWRGKRGEQCFES